ncbi:MAG: lyase family protein [Candidatus Woesearchaeota archaeon]
MADDKDLVSMLDDESKAIARFRMESISPDDGKYAKSANPLRKYLSVGAEWKECAYIQYVLLDTRKSFGQAQQWHVDEVFKALEKFDPLNTALLEDKIKHDQLAVLEELGRHISPETKALLHPGTTSYDILDTARSSLFKNAWNEVMKPEILKSIKSLSDLAVTYQNVIQVGRTHLQNTSPVLFGGVLAGYAARLADCTVLCDQYFNDLRGKISGITGTGASIDMVIGQNESTYFEFRVLKTLGLEPDYTATQIVQKERLANVGHGLVALMHVLGDFANDMRLLYSSAIQEVTDRDGSARLGGSSADATKNNPINWENINGKVAVVESGMRVLYGMIQSDFQRDLRNSVQGRYQPGMMMAQTYESFDRMNRALKTLSINEDKMAANLMPIRQNPGEALVAILRGEGWIHSKYGIGHDFVKKMALEAKKTGLTLKEVCMKDEEFVKVYTALPEYKQGIIDGKIENYLGSADVRMRENLCQCNNLLVKEGVIKSD